MKEIELRFLRRLRDAQPQGLSRSSVPTSCNCLVESLRTCGAREMNRASTGRGIVLRIRSDQAFERFVTARLPRGLDIDVSAVSDQAAAVVMLADAKAIRRAVGQGILVRTIKPNVAIQSVEGQASVSISDMSSADRAVGIRLPAESTWSFAGTVLIVEGAYAFWRYELLLPYVDLAILSGGNMSAALVNWLGSSAMAQSRFIHWGDYDPVGVCQYIRLAKSCPGRVKTYAPKKVEELLPHGKRELVTTQGEYLDRLRSHLNDPCVRRMVDLF